MINHGDVEGGGGELLKSFKDILAKQLLIYDISHLYFPIYPTGPLDLPNKIFSVNLLIRLIFIIH